MPSWNRPGISAPRCGPRRPVAWGTGNPNSSMSVSIVEPSVVATRSSSSGAEHQSELAAGRGELRDLLRGGQVGAQDVEATVAGQDGQRLERDLGRRAGDDLGLRLARLLRGLADLRVDGHGDDQVDQLAGHQGAGHGAGRPAPTRSRRAGPARWGRTPGRAPGSSRPGPGCSRRACSGSASARSVSATPDTRPSTSSMRVMARSLVASATTLRITRSPSSIGLRPGMSRARHHDLAHDDVVLRQEAAGLQGDEDDARHHEGHQQADGQ